MTSARKHNYQRNKCRVFNLDNFFFCEAEETCGHHICKQWPTIIFTTLTKPRTNGSLTCHLKKHLHVLVCCSVQIAFTLICRALRGKP